MTQNLWTIFLTGLTTGGLTCLAVQGGLLATALTRQATLAPTGSSSTPPLTGVQLSKDPLPIFAFLSAKLLAHLVAGFLLGMVGAAAQITPAVQGVMQVIAGLFMLATALNMLNVHPIFRYVVIQPPKTLTRMIRNQAKSEALLAPSLLGALTVLIPCGTTQAMAILAVSSGSPIMGALIMGFFTLGTSPTFFVLGFLATRLRGQLQRMLTLATIALILVMSMVSLDAGLNLLSSPLAPSRLAASLTRPFAASGTPAAPQIVDGVQEVVINIRPDGYQPNDVKVRSGQPLRLKLVAKNSNSCARVFTIPSMKITLYLDATDEQVIDLPAQPPGTLFFTCGMGMYSGQITIS
jgi:uncharacterized protein